MNKLKSWFKGQKKYNIGLVLSGGGARGFAHAGIIKALNEADIFPDVISGVSAGAIVGALYADGFTPDEMIHIFKKEVKFFNYVKLTMPGKGFMNASGLEEKLKQYLRAKNFRDLKMPLYIAATDLNHGKIVYFKEGDIVQAIMASTAIPVLFNPVEIDGITYVDGGVLDNMPVHPIHGKCNKIIGAYLNPIKDEKEFNTLFMIAERTFRLSVSANIEQKLEQIDTVIEVRGLEKFGMLDAGKGNEMFELGYEQAKKKIN
jgi:NTE family protein